jgi:hypothetical protein
MITARRVILAVHLNKGVEAFLGLDSKKHFSARPAFDLLDESETFSDLFFTRQAFTGPALRQIPPLSPPSHLSHLRSLGGRYDTTPVFSN